jgi:PIN domain
MRQILVLDACVLYPFYIRDFILRLGEKRLFASYWSPQIEEEWTRNLKANRPDINPIKIDQTRQAMNRAYPDACVERFDNLAIALPDMSDLHVVSLAAFIEADAVITFNVRDFPAAILSQYDLEVVHPDTWIMGLLEQFPFDVITVFQKWLVALKRPPLSTMDLLTHLTNNGLPMTAEAIRRKLYA